MLQKYHDVYLIVLVDNEHVQNNTSKTGCINLAVKPQIQRHEIQNKHIIQYNTIQIHVATYTNVINISTIRLPSVATTCATLQHILQMCIEAVTMLFSGS